MPWRENRDPYRIWVSEIMLQQTRVETVVAYFNRFLEKFPTVAHLAQAEEQEVMKAWEGLGYYSRARNLRKGAQVVMAQFNGRIPCTYEELITIPGIGDYTAGAILSIAFNQEVPAVDGNVLRVLSRVFLIEQDIALPGTKQEIRKCAAELIPEGEAWSFNQGLMELGALICIPKNPRCLACPLYSLCQARMEGKQDDLPVKKVKKPVKQVNRVIAIVWDGEKVLIRKRPSDGLLGGLWEFIGWDGESQGYMELEVFLAELGCSLNRVIPIVSAAHTFTHMKWLMQGYLYETEPEHPEDAGEDYRWVLPEQIQELPFPTALKKYVQWVNVNLTGSRTE